jgi:prepilin-type N-terminal cleavage/methylation domain-containing protein
MAVPGARRRRGSTLLEVMIALTIVAVAVVSVTRLALVSARREITIAAWERSTSALVQASDWLDALPFDSLPGKAGCRNVPLPSFSYNRCITVTDVGSVRRIRVVVSPQGTRARPDTMTFTRARSVPPSPLP